MNLEKYNKAWEKANPEKRKTINARSQRKRYHGDVNSLKDPIESVKRFYRRPNIQGLKGEDLISKQLTDVLDILRIAGKVNGIYVKIANEGINTIAFNTKLRAIGRLAGFPDYLFLWKEKALMIELKTPRGYLSVDQKMFFSEAGKYGCNIHVAKSVDQALNILYEFGFLKKD